MVLYGVCSYVIMSSQKYRRYSLLAQTQALNAFLCSIQNELSTTTGATTTKAEHTDML